MTPILGILASGISGNLWAPGKDFDSIATTTVGATSVADITFSSIPATYRHLQIRLIGRLTSTGNRDNLALRLNSDTGSNYWYHQLQGSGSAAAAESAASLMSRAIIGTTSIPQDDAPASVYGAAVIDVLDYANTNKYKTLRGLAGQDQNSTDGRVQFGSSLWSNTAAINSITLFSVAGNWKQYTSIALYGIK